MSSPWAGRCRLPRTNRGRPAAGRGTACRRYLGAVPNLPNLKVHQLDEEVVTGVWTDEFDVPHVRVHRILR